MPRPWLFVPLAGMLIGCVEGVDSASHGATSAGAEAVSRVPQITHERLLESTRKALIVLKSYQRQVEKHFADQDTDMKPGSWNFDPAGSGFEAHLGKLKDFAAFLSDTLNSFKLEARLAQPGDFSIEVNLHVNGLVDGIPYPVAVPELKKTFGELWPAYLDRPELNMNGNRTLCFVRAMTAAQKIRPRIHEALKPIQDLVVEKRPVITCAESKVVDGKYRGVEYKSWIVFTMPSHEMAMEIRGKLLNKGVADEVILFNAG